MPSMTRRSLFRTSLGLVAAGAVTRPFIAKGQVPNFVSSSTVTSDTWARFPRNVVYYEMESPIPDLPPTPADPLPWLATVQEFPYTDVIIGFLVPDPTNTHLIGDNSTIWGPDNNINGQPLMQLKGYIQRLRSVGKNVLLSVGGQVRQAGTPGAWTSELYQSWFGNERALAQEIANWVTNLGASGVDIDYEDDNALVPTPPYSGVMFLEQLTINLFSLLPTSGNIITHAPPSPFWDTNTTPYNFNGAYLQVHQSVGKYIAWYNTQFYGNAINGNLYDGPIESKIALYKQFAAAMGQPEKLLLGVSLDPSESVMNPNQTFEGGVAYPGGDSDLANAIAQLEGSFPQFGGCMTWELPYDYANGQYGYWSRLIAGALAPEVNSGADDAYTAPPY